MMKRIIALLLALILTVGLLPTVALATEGDTPVAGTSSDVKNGYYEGTTWKEGTLNQGTLPTGVVSVSKTAKKVEGEENKYEVTLEVVLKKTESQENPGSAATVLVLDHSGSMNGCAYCKSTTDDGVNYYHTEGCKYDKPHQWVRVTSEQSRMSAATKAVKDFIKTYSGRFDENGNETTTTNLNLGRWVCLVWFNETGGVTGGSKWVDVSNKSGYQTATNTDGWKAHDGTNLDCGLRLADYQLKKDTVAKISKNLKNVIVLSDGEPTYHLSKSWEVGDPLFHYDITIDDTGYYVHGNGGSCDEDTYNTTKSTAATLRNSASVYTVCFGASGNEIRDYDKNGNQKITVGNYLKQKIATQPKAGTTEKFAYDAADADALNTAFAAISKTIVSGLNTGTVKDSLPKGITATGMSGEMTWKLDEDFTAAEPVTTTEDGRKVTTYKYTKTYTVTINPDDKDLVTTGDGYAPLNGKTTLTVKNSQGTDVEIPFPIPAGKVTPTTFTVTWKSQDGNTELEKDENVAKNSKPSYDGATPTKAEDDMYTYTFVGWALSDGQETGTSAADLPNVTADVTYYAAFSEQLKQYTVTGTIDNNGAVTGSGQKVNAGGSSAAMTFTPAAGYKIISVKEKVGEVETTITDFAETGYTYPVKNDIRANITVDVKTAKRSDLKYVVKHVEKDNATNVLATRDKTGTLDEVIHGEAQKENFTGFTYAECSPASIKISATEDNNVITLYYTRNKYKVTYTYTGSVPQGLQPPTETEYDFGASVMIANAPDAVPGYTFEGWKRGTEDATNFSMPAENVTITGNWKKNDDAGYTIEYYLETLTEGTFEKDNNRTISDRTGTIGTIASVTDEDKVTIPGFTFDASNTNNVLSDTILEDGSLTLKLYYTRNSYKVTYQYTGTVTPGDATKLPDEVTYKYGAEVTVAAAATSADYVFSGWSRTGTFNMPAEDVIITGHWTLKDPTAVNVDLNDHIYKTFTSDTVDIPNDELTFNVTVRGTSDNAKTMTRNGSVEFTKQDVQNNTTSKAFTFASDPLTFTAAGEYTFEVVEGTTPVINGLTYNVNNETPLFTIVVDKKENANELYVKEVRVGTTNYEGVALTDTLAYATITNTYTEPKNAQVTNKEVVVTQPEGALKTAVNAFKIASESEVTVLYPTGNGTTSNTLEVSYGTTAATLLYKITVYAGTESSYTFEDKDASFVYAENAKTVTKNGDYFTVTFKDGAEYAYVYVAVTHAISYDADGEYKARNFIGSQGAETTVTEKDPNKLTINFADFVKKELTATGSKTANDVKFRVIVNGMESPYMMYNVGEEEVSTYAAFDPKYSTVLNVNFASITGGNTETEWFIADNSIVIDQAGIYYFELNEEDGKRTGVTYDDSIYKVLVYVERKDDKLVVKSFDIMKDNVYVDGDTITFHNTIDTGKDDYYPIIIPTIINKDTGMLNKTDHFAYVIGYPDGTVHPNGQITRAEVATIFFRLLRDEVRDGAFTTSNSYSDVAYGKWYNNPISTMSALGIITGYPDGTFKPNKPITRAEFAAIAARFDETQSGKSATFSDVIGHWAAKEIGIAYYNDWIKGYPDGTFKPDQNITRAEAMTLINRVLERKPESPADLLTNMNKWTDNMDTSKWYYLDVQEATNSHGYTRKTFNYELWRQMLNDPDWSRYER